MKVAFFTEMGFNGKIPRTHKNMRTEFAWMVALNATHYNLKSIPSENYDLGIVVNSKNNPEWVNVEGLKSKCEKVAIMQEGPFWYFQDYPLAKQIHYFNNLTSADIIYAHNEVDVQYFKGLTNHKDVRVLRSLMVEDPINEITHPKSRSGIMVGGNMKSWYGGFDSFMLASSVTDEIYQPKMGRREEGEDELGLTQLPYMEWDQWISELSKRKIGVHMMRTHAAGTFALNCSYLGIPCIGYDGLDTQRILHPHLTVKDGDLNTARNLINRLDTDKDFYTLCSNETLGMYGEHYHESKFKI
ncbi:hypothetical protein OAC50_00390 [bacterium]|jgi:hypothetical protein|nr:hypothetical protein [bacterium]|tara:strand:+ start:209 stop:1108 length:900 start_codon:yes stop_codon:yes gene_type:complete